MMKNWIAGMTIPSLLLVSACGSGTSTQTSQPAQQPKAEEPKKEAPAAEPAKSDGDIKERTIKFGIGLNEDHPTGVSINKFKELVEQKSGGKIKVNNYFSATLGDDIKMTEALQGGLQEITLPSTSPLVGTVKEFGIFDFPFIFNNEKEADAILDGPVGQKVLEKLPEHGLVGLGYWENGFRNLTNSKHPVATMDDFKGLKIRTMQNNVHLEAFKTLGANPTPMAFSEVFTALESKAVDGQENPLATIKSNKFNEVQEYLSLTKHVYTPFVFLVSKIFWDQLSPEEQKIISESAVEAGKFQRELTRQSNEKDLEDLKQAGMKVNDVSDEEKKKIQEALQKPVIDKYAKEFGEDLFKEMMGELAKLR